MRISCQLTVEARDTPAVTSVRLLAVLNVGFKYARIVQETGCRAARLVLTGLSHTWPRHLVRKGGGSARCALT